MKHLVPDPDSLTMRGRSDAPTAWTSSDQDSFSWTVLHQRHPLLIEQVRTALPYGPHQNAALDRLAVESTDGVVQPLDPNAHDAAAWQHWNAPWIGRRWDEAPFLWAENYFYRRVLDAIDYFTPGPWYTLDPFAHQKSAELTDAALDAELTALDRLADLSGPERGAALLLSAVWGNRADLGFAAHAARPDLAISESLIVDESSALWGALSDRRGPLCFVADNAGRELLADLMLIDELLSADWVDRVVLHVKPTPYFVSDATAADVAACLTRLANAGGYAAQSARRLHIAFREGRCQLRTSWFYVAPLEYDSLPADITTEIAAAPLTILKGDLNYRRVFGDRHWEPTTDASKAASYFPGPFALLRTLKSEVVVGLPAHRLAELETEHPGWRTTGNHAMVQAVV